MFLGPLLLGHTFAWSRSTVFFHTLPRQNTSGLGTGYSRSPGVRVPASAQKEGLAGYIKAVGFKPRLCHFTRKPTDSILGGYAYKKKTAPLSECGDLASVFKTSRATAVSLKRPTTKLFRMSGLEHPQYSPFSPPLVNLLFCHLPLPVPHSL